MGTFLDAFYWIFFIATLLAACVVACLVAAGQIQGRRAIWAVVASFTMLLVAGRWPTILIAGWLNPDESMMLAQALKFSTDPMPWRAIDPGTGGPVNSYALLPLHWLGMEIGYPLARTTAIACLAAYICLMFLAMQRIAGIATAAIAILPATMFHAVATKVVAWFFGRTPFAGWAPLMMAILLVGGIIMMMLGIIGEYLWRILDEIKDEPLYVLDRD